MFDYGNAHLQEINSDELKGKTIQDINSQAANVLLIEFTDGTQVAIECHHEWIGVDFYAIMKVDSYPSTVNVGDIWKQNYHNSNEP